MAIFFDAPVIPDALTTFVRRVPLPYSLELSQSFPTRQLPTNMVDFAEIVKTSRTAKFRTFDGRIHVSERDSGSERRVNLLPLSSSLNMGEYERLQLEFARTQGTNIQALANAVYNDAENLVNEVRNRMELAWGDVLTDGKLTINEGGYQGEADFGVPAEQLTTAATPWTATADAQILDDLIAISDVYVKENGMAPQTMRVSLRTLRVIQQNKQLINAVYGAQTGKTRISRQDLNDLLAGEGLPTLLNPYDTVLDVDGAITRVIPEGKVIFAPQNLGDLGFTAWGVSATALELVNSRESEMSFEDAPGIVGVVIKDGPPFRQFTYVDAVGMPILANPRLLAVHTVA